MIPEGVWTPRKRKNSVPDGNQTPIPGSSTRNIVTKVTEQFWLQVEDAEDKSG